MDITTSSETKPIIIEQMNLCRQFLKITYLSDITTADGTSISNDIINMIPNQSSYEWHIIPHPPIKLQTIWQKTLTTTLCEPKTNHLLRQYKLGQWIIPPKKSHTIFRYYISPTTNMINKIKDQYISSSLIT